jgi:hypothetical protein
VNSESACPSFVRSTFCSASAIACCYKLENLLSSILSKWCKAFVWCSTIFSATLRIFISRLNYSWCYLMSCNL